jgi:sterol desaturase/sphingolipid hydroxylase (fatty acid hydroxylase superfamily)
VLVPCLILTAALAMAVVERMRPGRELAHVQGWPWRVALLNGLHALLVIAGGVWLQPWLASIRPWSADALGTLGGAVFGYLVVTFVYYWWHRARHEVPWLWRVLHQTHHAPQRLEVATSFYKHPLEAASNVVFGGFLLYVVCGLDPEVAQWTVLVNSIAEFFYHWNVKTPRWTGWILQRPEAHCAHHELGAEVNYADLPLWDWLFGTLHNPTRETFDTGRADEHRLAELLLCVDLDDADRPRSPLRYHAIAVALTAVGCLSMVGDVVGSPHLYGLGLATGASPAPKVFTSRDGLESFSAEFVVEWDDATGTHQVALDPAVYARLEGPYNRRNVYGAALAGGPVLAGSAATAPLLDAVADGAFCGERSVLDELGIDASTRTSPLRLRVVPTTGVPDPAVPLTLEVRC